MVTIVTKTDAHRLIKVLRDQGYWVTETSAIGNDGFVSMMVTIIKRKEIKNIIPLIKRHNPWAAYTISYMRYANPGIANVPVTYDVKRKIRRIRRDKNLLEDDS